MTAVALGSSYFKRLLAETPEILCTNVFLEKSPATSGGVVWLQRPALASLVSVGVGPTRGMYQQAGAFGGDYLVVSGTELFRVTELGVATQVPGSIAGARIVNIAASKTRAIIATGDTLYSTDGLTITTVITPADIPMSSVEFINQYFVASQTDSQRIYFLAPGDVDFDALNFFSAEYASDNVVGIKRLGDLLWIFGETTIEIWTPTGNADAPFQRVEGQLYQKGCANRDTIVLLDNTLFWVGHDKIVYRASTVPERISDNGIEERIRLAEASELKASSFTLDGHTFYVMTAGDQGTFVYDVSTQEWLKWSSYGRETWRAHVITQSSGSFILAGDDTTGDLWKLISGRSNDNGTTIIRELTGGVAVANIPVRCDSFSVNVASGRVPLGLTPTIMFRYSDNTGNTWSSWNYMTIGRTGDYNSIWNAWRLGLMRQPGRVFQIRMTDDVVFRISQASINEAFAA